jgi:UPF0755 protein
MGRLILTTLGYACLVALLLATVGVVWGYAEFTRPGPLQVSRVVVIAPGSGLERIADTLESNSVVQQAEIFSIGAKMSGLARALMAGEYRFPERASPRDVMEILKSGRTVVRRLTLAEGLTVGQVLKKLATSDSLSGDIQVVPEEGTLLPETYHFSHGDHRAALVARMQDGMVKLVARFWKDRAADLPYHTPAEAVALASIIERETGFDNERSLIAGVFVNRLRRGMRLQSDPTVAYGIAPEGLGRPLTRGDLRRRTLHNTYIIKGLPPTPICNPGMASIRAALNPAKTDFLYFVADGIGGHAFAKTLQDHNHNVARWRHLQKKSQD